MVRRNHCFPWAPEAEHIAAEKIKENSKSRPLGNLCSCCPLCCFSRPTVFRLYMFGFIAIVISSVGIALSAPELKRIITINNFVPTTCTVIDAQFTGDVYKCNKCAKNKNKPECYLDVECFQVKVKYQADSQSISETNLYYDWESMTNSEDKRCIALSDRCNSFTPATRQQYVTQNFGTPGKTAKCFYNPADEKQVLVFKDSIQTFTAVQLVVSCIVLLVALVVLFSAPLTCGCYHLCSTTPPPEIQDELNRRNQQRMTEAQMQAPPLGYNPQYQGQYPGTGLQQQPPPGQQFQGQQYPPPPSYQSQAPPPYAFATKE